MTDVKSFDFTQIFSSKFQERILELEKLQIASEDYFNRGNTFLQAIA